MMAYTTLSIKMVYLPNSHSTVMSATPYKAGKESAISFHVYANQ